MTERCELNEARELFLEPSISHRCLPLTTGLAAFNQRRWSFRNARKQIWISTFLWRHDRTGSFLIDRLVDRVEDEVDIRILIDHWGAGWEKNSVLHRLRAEVDAGHFRVKVFNPLFQKFHPWEMETAWAGMLDGDTLNHRMHAKMTVVDDASAMVGGRNIGDEYFDLHRFRCFADAELLVGGPAVAKLQAAFCTYWDHPLSVDLASFDVTGTTVHEPLPATARHRDWKMFLEIADGYDQGRQVEVFHPEAIDSIVDAPNVDERQPTDTADETFRFFAAAHTSLRITSPILIFQKEWLQTFRDLRELRPDLALSLVTNSLVSTDNLYTYAAGLCQRRPLLGHLQARLHEIRALPNDVAEIVPSYPRLQQENSERDEQPESGFGSNRFECRQLHTTLHAKFSVRDEQWVLLGSPNLDPRSLIYNCELLLNIRCGELAEHYSQVHDRYRLNRNSWLVAPRNSRTMPQWWLRILLLWYRLTGWGYWPYRDGRCFEPLPTTPDEIPDPTDEQLTERYRSVGIYSGVDDSQRRIEMVFLENLTAIFRGWM